MKILHLMKGTNSCFISMRDNYIRVVIIVSICTFAGVMLSCQTTAVTNQEIAPLTGIFHYDTALTFVEYADINDAAPVYSYIIQELIKAEMFFLVEPLLEYYETRLINGTASLSAWGGFVIGWQRLAKYHLQYAEDAQSSLRLFLQEISNNSIAAVVEILPRVLHIQLQDINTELQSLADVMDELYLIDDDLQRASTLATVAELIQQERDIQDSHVILQQAIATTYGLDIAFSTMALAVRLAVHSAVLNNMEDTQRLLQYVLDMSKNDIFVRETELEDAYDMVNNFVGLDALEMLKNVAENIFPLRIQALIYAYIAYTVVQQEGEAGDDYFAMANTVAASITVEGTQFRTIAEILLLQSTVSKPNELRTYIAEFLSNIAFHELSAEDRVDVIAKLRAAYLLLDLPNDARRLRTLTDSPEEMRDISFKMIEIALQYERIDIVESILLSLNDKESDALRSAEYWLRAGDYTAAIWQILLQDDLLFAAYILSQIPADYLLPIALQEYIEERI